MPAQPFNITTDPDDELVFVEFAPASQVEGHGFPVDLGPQRDAHADAWLDALNLHAPSGYRAEQPRYIVLASTGSLPVVFDTVAERSIEGGRRFQPQRASEIATELNAAVAALPAPAPIPSLPVAFALRRAAFGPVTA